MLLWLRKFCGFLLLAIGLLTGVLGICWTLLFTSLWFKGENLSLGERHGWLACAGAGVGGSLAFWAGVSLLRSRGTRPGRDGSFRLHLTGPQRRRSVNAGLRGTFLWLFVATEVCFIFLHGDAMTRVRHALEGVCAIYLGIHGVVLLHELGHLSLAAVLGLDLQKLQVGTGPIIFKRRFGELHVEWRALLGGGLVLTADDRERGWRWRHWLYVAGGPAATTVGCMVLAWWIEQRHRGGSWLGGSNGIADVVAMSLCAYSALFWLTCLLPTKASVGTVHARTDGYQLLHTPRFTPEKIRSLVIMTRMRRVEMLWEENRREAAWERIREILGRYPGQAMLSAAEGHYLGEQGDYLGAAASYQRWLQTDDLPAPARKQIVAQRFAALAHANEPEAARQCCEDALRDMAPAHRAAQLDAFATEVLQNGLRAFLPEADAWSQEALALEPKSITLKGTRGAVLMELGRFDEGEALLREVWAVSASEVDAAISAFYLGVAAKRHGNKRQVLQWFGRSKNFAPFVGKWLLERIAEEMVPVPSERAAGT